MSMNSRIHHKKEIPKVLLVLLSLCAFANSLIAGQMDGFYYEDRGGHIEITMYYHDQGEAVVIPAMINGKPVASIGPSAFASSMITSATIPDSVHTIGDAAFESCWKLGRVTIGSGVISIGSRVFNSCDALRNISVDNSNPEFSSENGVFYNKTKSKLIRYPQKKDGFSYTIPDTVTEIGEDAFRTCSSLVSITIPGNTISIGNSAFRECASLVSIAIPDSVVSMGSGVLTDCMSLVSVTLPSSLQQISDESFYGCASLIRIELPSGIQSIGSSAFALCHKLLNVVISGEVTVIGDSAFHGCASLIDITIPDGVTFLGESAFAGCSGLVSVVIPNSVTSLGSNLFNGCASLKNVTLPDGMTSIGHYMFASCGSLTSLVIPGSIRSIRGGAFENCRKLSTIVIPDSVTSIEERAFSFCESLVGITLPVGLVSIGDYAFSFCAKLTGITLPDSVTSIGNGAFSSCRNLAVVSLGVAVTRLGYSAFDGCPRLASIQANPGNAQFASKGGILYSHNLTKIILFPPAISGVVTLEDGLESIPDGLLGHCKRLTRIVIPASVESIGNSAFAECTDLVSIDVDERNESYSSLNGILYNRDQTKLVRYPAGRAGMFHRMPGSVTTIRERAFYKCRELFDITIPDGVQTIGQEAFHSTGLRNIAIPASITSIGNQAFFNTRLRTKGILFLGNAPKMGYDVFYQYSYLGVSVCHLEGAMGFDKWVWQYYRPTIVDASPIMQIYPAHGKSLRSDVGKIELGEKVVGNTSDAITLTIKNNGAKRLGFESPAITIRGRNALDFEVMQPSRAWVAPGAVATFKIRFKPKEANMRMAELRIRSNDPETPSFVIQLQGEGLSR